MLSLYIEILPSMDRYLVDCGLTNLKEVEQFLEYLGGIEDQVFKNRLERESKRRTELQEMRDKDGPPVAGQASGGQMGGDLAGGESRKRSTPAAAAASDTNAWHAQLLAQSFSMDLDNLEGGGEGEENEEERKK